jgi:hypothetical protein
LSTAEQLLIQEIDTDINNHTSYANRSFVMARKHHWDHALQDAIKVRYTEQSSVPLEKQANFHRDIVRHYPALLEWLYL